MIDSASTKIEEEMIGKEVVKEGNVSRKSDEQINSSDKIETKEGEKEVEKEVVKDVETVVQDIASMFMELGNEVVKDKKIEVEKKEKEVEIVVQSIADVFRSEEHTSELQSPYSISYSLFI